MQNSEKSRALGPKGALNREKSDRFDDGEGDLAVGRAGIVGIQVGGMMRLLAGNRLRALGEQSQS